MKTSAVSPIGYVIYMSRHPLSQMATAFSAILCLTITSLYFLQAQHQLQLLQTRRMGVGVQGLCHVYSSGSGATFGMLVLFIADMAFNFETIRFPIMRILAAAILLGVFIAAAVVRGLPARLSVLGGALTALFPVLSLLPHLKSEKFEWWIPYMSLFTICGFLLALPLYVYLKRLPGISC